MPIIRGTEKVVNPLQESALSKKGLCDYVINVASGCLHGCTFCYVPSTPVIRARQSHLKESGIDNPQMDWGKYLLIREGVPEKLEEKLSRKRTWYETPAGRGVVLLCSGTDPYQNKEVGAITRRTIEILLKYGKRVRLLTRSPLWLNDLDVLANPNVTIGMSLPYIEDELSRQIEPNSPPPTARYKALLEGAKHGCRLYVAVAPTPPEMTLQNFVQHLDKVMAINPEVIFWEPINARGTNGKRMLAAGLEFAQSVMGRGPWVEYFIRQWGDIEEAAERVGCIDRLHIWPDRDLTGAVNESLLNYWWHRPTVETWDSEEYLPDGNRPFLKNHVQLSLFAKSEIE
ncbi:radical SAM protein [Trichocoleus sp. FACHB-591]|uniref:SPL family radical SAM protein n=1 Tax=Trichocoleus sp. FACHB-591 TaxID=2692872 RepID=UPI0018EF6DCA|nr:radical SAM protein [Trichocoleus sp. FACHB-591]